MSQASQMTLWIFGGLADPNSNILRLLINSSGLSKAVQTKLNRSAFGRDIPALQDGKSVCKRSLREIIEHIMKYDKNLLISPKLYAYRSGFEQRLYYITLFHNWYTDVNATHTINCYKGHINGLIALVFAIRTRQSMKMEIENFVAFHYMEDPLLWVRNEARDCFSELNSILGSKAYLLGDSPNILDAIVVGYLNTILYLEHPNSTIRDILYSKEELCTYVKRFNKLYGDGVADKEHSRFKKKLIVNETEVTDGVASWSAVIAAGTFATCAMGTYAYSIGLFGYN